MSPEALRAAVEAISDIAEKPTYNSLEVGFRHSVLTQKEICERLRDACEQIACIARGILQEIGND